jgi:hypothetical protein
MHPPDNIEEEIEKGYVRNIGSPLFSPTSILGTPPIHNDRNSQIGKNQTRSANTSLLKLLNRRYIELCLAQVTFSTTQGPILQNSNWQKIPTPTNYGTEKISSKNLCVYEEVLIVFIYSGSSDI